MSLGDRWGLLAPGMGGEAARAVPPILQVESLSHHYWASQPWALGQPGRGPAVAVTLGAGWETGPDSWSVNHCALL